MPFDAFFLTAVRRELEGSLTGCRIDKVQQLRPIIRVFT